MEKLCQLSATRQPNKLKKLDPPERRKCGRPKKK